MASGHIRRRGRTSWELKFDIRRGSLTGKRLIKTKTVKGTRRDAERALRNLLTALDTGTYADSGRLTLGAWLDRWLDGRRHSIAPKTAERYAELIANHLKPVIGAIALGKVTTAQLNEFYADRLGRGRIDGKGGLSAQTVRHLDRLLHRVFHDAIKARLLAFNPTDFVERPKIDRKPKRTLQEEEFAALFRKAAGGLLKAGIHPKVAQVRAGHSSVTVTMDIYSHVTDGMQREAAEQIDNVLTGFQKI